MCPLSEDIKKEQTPEQEAEAEQAEGTAVEAETQEAELPPDEAAEAAGQDDELDNLRAALQDAEKKRDEYLALAQRSQADYQNFKRRNSAVRTEAYDDGVRETLTAMLPVLDNLERAIAAAESDTDPLVSGVQMTLRQMLDAMGKLGLEEVPALGEKFDPDIHNAVMRVQEGEPGTVLEVFQKGYRVKDRMIRYAMVKIAAED